MATAKPRRRAVSRAAAPAIQTWYVESSALVAAFVEVDAAAQQAVRASGRRVTSALTLTEAHRAVLRGRLSGRLTAEDERGAVRGLQTFSRRCDIVSVSEAVLVRAGRPFPVEPIRTLDAIHLATVELLGEPPQLVTVVTRDTRVAENARALGYTVA